MHDKSLDAKMATFISDLNRVVQDIIKLHE